MKNNEWNAILLALSGSYVKYGLLADPTYGDSIPTGYDGYASNGVLDLPIHSST